MDLAYDEPYAVGAADFFHGMEFMGGENKAVVIGPMMADKVVYGNTTQNTMCSLWGRYEAKKVAPTLTAADLRCLTNTTKLLIKKHFTRDKILKAAEEIGMLEFTKSKKWSVERFNAHVQELLAKDNPKFGYKANVKAEPMEPGKPPRTVIDEGGCSQVMAAAVIMIIEKILFKAFPRSNIKGRPKKEAMEAGIQYLNMCVGQCVMEGDGSAWDACCNDILRAATENLVISEVTHVLLSSGCPLGQEQWLLAHLESCEAKKMNLKSGKRGYVEIFQIDSIRRSGHRGTSVLNYLLNLIVSLVAIYENPFGTTDDFKTSKPGAFLDNNTKGRKDRWGVIRAIKFMFEGDDSIYTLFPRLSKSQMADVEAFWSRCGHRLKLFEREGAENKCAEFTGWILPIGTDGLIIPEFCGPDILRGLTNSGISCSREIVDAFTRGDSGRVRQIAAASYLAYAEECQFPIFRNFFYRMADHYGYVDGVTTLEHATRNQKMVLAPDEEADYKPVTKRGELGTSVDEYNALHHIGIVHSPDHFLQVLDFMAVAPTFGRQAELRSLGLGPYIRKM